MKFYNGDDQSVETDFSSMHTPIKYQTACCNTVITTETACTPFLNIPHDYVNIYCCQRYKDQRLLLEIANTIRWR